jgi:integrase
MPAHHQSLSLSRRLHAWAGLFGAKGTPLFRSADWRSRALTDLPMHRIDVWRMIRRRATAAGIDPDMCCHTFRATGLTNFLANGGTLENAQAMAHHASPRTTQFYGRTSDEITRDEVEADDLLGDSVNVAARLEQLCIPSGIMISGTAYDQLKGKLGLPLDFA